LAPVVQLGVQEVYVVEEHFHCDGPEQEQTDRQVGGNYHWAVELVCDGMFISNEYMYLTLKYY
jgi:hypothetical protein